MNKAKEVLNKKYAELCQQKGDLINQREKIDALLEEVDKAIQALNTATHYLPEIQVSVLNEFKEFQKPSKLDKGDK